MPAASFARRVTLLAPISGIFVPLSEVPDPIFAQKLVGEGIAIDPAGETLVAPADGRITQMPKSCHVINLTTPEGIEILIHIGLGTVLLNGRGFRPRVRKGDLVRAGDPLVVFDADMLAREAASLMTIMIVANGNYVKNYFPASGFAEGGKSTALELELADGAGLISGLFDEAESIVESEPMLIMNPYGMHARPATVLVNGAKPFKSEISLIKMDQGQRREANAKSLVSLLGLGVGKHERVRLRTKGEDAVQAMEALTALIKSGLGENIHGPIVEAPQYLPMVIGRKFSLDPNVLTGVPASGGLVAGKIFQLKHDEIRVERTSKGELLETEAFEAAIRSAKKELKYLQNLLRLKADTGKAAVFAAHAELLDDPELLGMTRDGIAEGNSAAFAWQRAFTLKAEDLAVLENELLAARASDIRDIGRRVLMRLCGSKEGMPNLPSNVILVAEDLSPSDTAVLDRSKVLGFCTTKGSATSHAFILARSIGIPAIASMDANVLALENGATVILDGDNGELRMNPSEEEVTRVNRVREARASIRRAELKQALSHADTRDGRRVKVVGNIGGVAEAEQIPVNGGEGVGLLRSEFLFLDRITPPSEAEQSAVYSAIARVMGPGRELVVRTLDVGGDKPLAYLPMPQEANPFLGVRGIRLNQIDTELFRSQVRSILSAAALTRLHIMFPMVSTVEELRRAKSVVLEEKDSLGISANVPIGIMVEVPSVAIMAEELAREADFFSIGTNDLTQYTMAVDRGQSSLSKIADGLHPAVLRLIAATVSGAHKHGKWVGVCGGLAGELLAIPALVGLGVDELSVDVASIPAVKNLVRGLDLAECCDLAGELLSMASASDVRARLAAFNSEVKEALHA